MRRIVCAALRSIVTGKIVCGVRHYDSIMRQLITERTGESDCPIRFEWKNSEQGFIDNEQEFLNREEAWVVAEAAGQIINVFNYKSNTGKLYSENLY